ncbi:ectoine synthase [Castellaniella daejeonensis]|jgi:L-ectoine synthase|uniref:L-ectoine synthase n=1 Tax=Castellaniella daejeonensis TaxID=659013 RepID=A0ABN0TG39_9BURK|nr:ectoine synthase [Castellaniella sp.]HET8704350.1 ectoine synthase [Castellaniella sp.]
MIVRNVKDVIGTDQEIVTDNWTSRRVLLASDGMGFSFHETVILPGTETHIHYRNHLEAVWCIEGDGEIETIADGRKYALGPGVVYALDQHDEHWLRGGERPLRVICVFNPPLTGREVHDASGVYPLVADAAGA